VVAWLDNKDNGLAHNNRFIIMTYLIYVASFGAAAVFFLWIRDARIFCRTGLPGYRTAAYRGVIFGAIALLGVFLTAYWSELIGLAVILGALYLQGRCPREKVWKGDENTWERLLGVARVQTGKKE
jgi:hypothetical protein